MLLVASLLALCLCVASGEPAGATSNSVNAVDDSTVVIEDAPATAIDVLGNDPAPDGTPNVIQSVDTTGTHGDVRIAGEPKRPPNIVFILTDDQSIESVAKMPFVSHYAGWDRFENAFLNDPVCCPSRASILTGLYAHHTGVENNADRSNFDDSSTIATWLHGAGYRTALFGKYHLLHNGAGPTYIPPGWDDWVGYPSGSYYDYTVNDNGQLVHYGSSPEDYSTDVISREAKDFLGQANAKNPFFLYLATAAPHDGWIPAPRHEGRFATEPIPHAPSFNEPDMSDKPSWWQARTPVKVPDIDNGRRKAYASLLGVDDLVKSVFDTLTEKGLVDNTVVVFMTDNGYSFGEHRWRGKDCAYEECIRTPLLIADPRGTPHTITDSVMNVDIAPTFADLAGVTPSTPVDGHSLVPFLNGSTPPDWSNDMLLRFKHDATQDSEDVDGTPPSFWGLRTPQYKYVETEDTGEVELYDLAGDPYELQNVANQPEYAGARAQLAQRLADLRAAPPHTETLTPTGTPEPGSILTYEPDPNYCNQGGPPDTFTYTLQDGSSATVSVDVACADDPPVAFDDSATVSRNDPATVIDVRANDTDVDGGLGQVESVDASGTVGSVTLTSDGAVQYKPAPGYCNDATSGTGWGPDDTFTYTLNGGSWATVYIKVRCTYVDGSGTMTVSPTAVRSGSAGNTLAFVYTPAPGGISNGAVSLSVPSGWPAPSTVGSDPGFTKTSAGVLSVAGQTLTISGLTRSETQPVTITYGAKSSGGPGASAPAAAGPQSWLAQSRASAAGSLQPLASSPAVAVLSPDGSGTMSPSPATVAKGSAGNTISFTYTAATGGMQNGSITLAVPSGWSAPSTTGADLGFATASTGSLTVSGRTITVAGINLNGTDTMTITYGDRRGGGPGATAPSTGQTWTTKQRSALGGTLTALASSPLVMVTAGAIDHFKVEAASGGAIGAQRAGVPFSIKITAQDSGNNTVTDFFGTVEIGSNRPLAGPPTSAPFTAGVLTSQSVTFAQGGLLSTISVVQTGGTAGGISNAFTTYAADGSGTMTVSPTAVRNGSTGNTLAFVYTPAPGGISNGAVSLSVPSGWPAPRTLGSDPGFTKTSAGVLSVAGQTLTVSGLTRSETQPVTITYGAKSSAGPGASAPSAGGSQSWQAQSRASAAGSLQPLASSPAVVVLSPDGSGTVSPSRATVTKGSAGNTISFTYTAATGGMQNGMITLVVPGGWSAPSTTGTDAGFVTASTGSLTVSGRTITVAGINLNGTDTMTITYGDRRGGGPGASAPSTAGAPSWTTKQRSSASGVLTPLASQPSVSAT